MDSINYQVTFTNGAFGTAPAKLMEELEGIGLSNYGGTFYASRYDSDAFTDTLAELSTTFPTALFDIQTLVGVLMDSGQNRQ